MIAVVVVSIVVAIVVRIERRKQLVELQAARADLENAKLTTAVALIALREYERGIYPAELMMAQGDVAVAEENLTQAKVRHAEVSIDLKRNPMRDPIGQDNQALQHAISALEQARTKKSVLENYTRDKTIKELTSEVEKARANELAKRVTYEQIDASISRLLW
jgi:hypothetical protein